MSFGTSIGVARMDVVCPVCGRDIDPPPMQPATTDSTFTANCPNGHSITSLGYVQLTEKVKALPFATTADTNAVSTGWAFPTNAILLDAWTKVTTADAGKTISVGDFASNSNEFLATITIATTGIKIPSLVAGGVTLGASLIETVTGSGSATHSARKPASVGGLTVGYKTSAAATTAGFIYVRFIEVP